MKRFFHPDTDWSHVRLHMPHGVIIGLALIVYPVVGAGLLCGFLIYELVEEFHG